MIATSRAVGERAGRWALLLLWAVVVGYPVLFSVLDNRSVYNGQAARLVEPTTLGYVNLGFSAAATVLGLAVIGHAWHARSGSIAGRLLAGNPQAKALVWPVCGFIGLLCLIAAAHGAFGPAMAVGLAGLLMIAVLVASEPAAVVLARVGWMFRAIIGLSVVTAIVLPGWAFVPYPHEGRALFGLGTRLIGLAPAPNYLALLAATLWFIELARARVEHARVNWLWAVAALVTCFWAQGRTAYLVVILVTLFFFRGPGRERVLMVLRGLVLLGLAMLSLLVPVVAVVAPLNGVPAVNELLTGRMDAWEVASAGAIDHPLIGYGPDAFDSGFWQRYESSAQGAPFGNAHNQWLDVVAGFGLVGASALLVLVLALLIVGWRVRDAAGGTSLMALVLIFAQFPFGTPLRIGGLSWNLLTVLTVLAVLAGLHAVLAEEEEVQAGDSPVPDTADSRGGGR